MSYGDSKTSIVVPAAASPPPCGCHGPSAESTKTNGRMPIASVDSFPVTAEGRPDFGKMDVGQRLAYHRKRLGLGV